MRLDNVVFAGETVPAWLVPVLLAAGLSMDACDGLHARGLPLLPVGAAECLDVCHEQETPMASVGPAGCVCVAPTGEP